MKLLTSDRAVELTPSLFLLVRITKAHEGFDCAARLLAHTQRQQTLKFLASARAASSLIQALQGRTLYRVPTHPPLIKQGIPTHPRKCMGKPCLEQIKE